MRENPLVTVITPSFNRAEYLEETIKSVLSQNYSRIEYIVLDDGSTDRSRDVLKKYKNKIIWKSHKNIGEIKTVNEGFALANGEIITVVNSDDPLLPGAVSSAVNTFTKNPEAIVVYGDWLRIDAKGRELGKVQSPEYNYEYMLKNHDNIAGPGAFFKKRILSVLKGRDPRFKYVSDYDFWLRAGMIGSFVRIPKLLGTSRFHSDQLTQKDKGLKMAMEHISVVNKIFSYPDLPEGVRKATKAQAYEKACEAARICRGDSFFTKLIVAFASLYYSPILYLKTFLLFRLTKLYKQVIK